MYLDLTSVKFTINSDIVPAAGKVAALELYSGRVNTLAGDDVLVGTGVDYAGIDISGILVTSDGNDTITGTARAEYSAGIQISSSGAINSGEGNDKITGLGTNDGISISGSLDSGGGNDFISGIGTDDFASGISNNGTLKTSIGNDEIHGLSLYTGISNAKTRIINTGIGDDLLTGAGSTGINNSGSIDTGTGNDKIIGISSTSYGGGGIENTGTINTGANDDVVDALIGGFSGDGSTNLGSGNDTLRGFGGGTFIGGTGTDRALFNPGVYKIKKIVATVFQVSSGYTGTNPFLLQGFELIGSALQNSSIGLKEGLLAINTSGSVSYL